MARRCHFSAFRGYRLRGEWAGLHSHIEPKFVCAQGGFFPPCQDPFYGAVSETVKK
ncbi:hypothetical protein EIO_2596 [Ketogulonicigenium vulgare Y25]|nr:hypothetical protein EIO_2596 [Ketogulonicigenium vulgare Y25]AOZ55708.1 hypothetical protein KVC_2706 [Ketogulonicigenium vulgare]